MCPYIQASRPCGLCAKVVTGILHNETEIRVSCEINCKLYLRNSRDIHRVWRIGSKSAVVIVRPDNGREACCVLVQLGKNRCRIISPGLALAEVDKLSIKVLVSLEVGVIDPIGRQPFTMSFIIVSPTMIA